MEIDASDLNPMGVHSEVLFHAPEIPKNTDEGRVGLLLGLVLTRILDCLLYEEDGYLAKEKGIF